MKRSALLITIVLVAGLVISCDGLLETFGANTETETKELIILSKRPVTQIVQQSGRNQQLGILARNSLNEAVIIG